MLFIAKEINQRESTPLDIFICKPAEFLDYERFINRSEFHPKLRWFRKTCFFPSLQFVITYSLFALKIARDERNHNVLALIVHSR